MNGQRMRLVAAAAAAGSAVLYYLIGVGVLTVGRSTTGADPDLASFGLTAGSAFVVLAIIVLYVERRWLLALVGLFDAAVIVTYFAVASMREPPFEPWGLAIKVLQATALVAIGALLFRRSGARPRTGTIAPAGGSS